MLRPSLSTRRWQRAIRSEATSRIGLAAFGKNPEGALKMAWDRAIMPFLDPTARKEVEERLEKEKAVYPGDTIRHWPIGSTVLWIMAFLLVYLLIYYI